MSSIKAGKLNSWCKVCKDTYMKKYRAREGYCEKKRIYNKRYRNSENLLLREEKLKDPERWECEEELPF